MPLNFDLKKIKDHEKCNIYFETGLWDVVAEDTSLCKAITMGFDKCFSVEINNDLVQLAKNKFKDEFTNGSLDIFTGDSRNLKDYFEKIKFLDNDRIVFFLDSHGHGHGCPLIEELDAIKDMNFTIKPIIILDDVRIIRDCVWSDNRYAGSTFEDVLKKKLMEINKDYEFSYLDGHIKDDCLMAS